MPAVDRIKESSGAGWILQACILLVLACHFPAYAMAQTESPWTLGLAVGHGKRSNPLLDSEDIDINLVVDIAWYGERLFFDNGDVGFNLHETSRLSVNTIGTFNNERNYFSYLSSKSLGLDLLATADSAEGETGSAPGDPGSPPRPVDELSGSSLLPQLDSELPERDFAFNAGLELLYLSRAGDFQAQVLSDISNSHNGQEAWVSWSYPWFTPSTRYDLTLGLEWKSANLGDYYYGVRSDEAIPGRPEYHTSAGVNSFIRFATRHSFNEHWSLVSVLEREQLSRTIRNSPIVDRDSVDTFFIGLYYRF